MSAYFPQTETETETETESQPESLLKQVRL